MTFDPNGAPVGHNVESSASHSEEQQLNREARGEKMIRIQSQNRDAEEMLTVGSACPAASTVYFHVCSEDWNFSLTTRNEHFVYFCFSISTFAVRSFKSDVIRPAWHPDNNNLYTL